jgi:hypothetical protein
MNLYVDSPREEAFRLVTDYFTKRRMKIVSSMPPSYVKAECGSWSFLSELALYPKGEIQANIQARDTGSDVSFVFDFSHEYLRIFLEALLTTALIWIFFLVYSTVNPWGTALRFSEGVAPATLITTALVALEVVVYGLRLSLTRKNLIKGFNRLIHLSSRKD